MIGKEIITWYGEVLIIESVREHFVTARVKDLKSIEPPDYGLRIVSLENIVFKKQQLELFD